MKKISEFNEKEALERKEIEEAIKKNGLDIEWVIMKTLHCLVILFMLAAAIYEIISL